MKHGFQWMKDIRIIHFNSASEKVDMMKLVNMAISEISQCQRYNFDGLMAKSYNFNKIECHISQMRQNSFFRIYLI